MPTGRKGAKTRYFILVQSVVNSAEDGGIAAETRGKNMTLERASWLAQLMRNGDTMQLSVVTISAIVGRFSHTAMGMAALFTTISKLSIFANGGKKMYKQWRNDGRSHYKILDDGRIFSYNTCILQRLEDGTTVGNVTKYSVTTSKHQSRAGSRTADILVDNIPEGTQYLR